MLGCTNAMMEDGAPLLSAFLLPARAERLQDCLQVCGAEKAQGQALCRARAEKFSLRCRCAAVSGRMG